MLLYAIYIYHVPFRYPIYKQAQIRDLPVFRFHYYSMVKAFNSWIVLLGAFTATASAVAQYASTIRAPAYPLAVRQPYVSTWLAANNLPGTWPTFW